jgi:hypothetical protein
MSPLVISKRPARWGMKDAGTVLDGVSGASIRLRVPPARRGSISQGWPTTQIGPTKAPEAGEIQSRSWEAKTTKPVWFGQLLALGSKARRMSSPVSFSAISSKGVSW